MTDGSHTEPHRPEDDVLLSVVITVTEGGETLTRLLRALASQVDAPRMEIIIPHDSSMAPLPEDVRVGSEVRLVPLGEVSTRRPPHSAAGQHELFDKRRAAGLASATGDIIGMLEDRAVPSPTWARDIPRLHEQPHAAVGGAIECGRTTLLGWALYVCDFGRYGLPLPDGPVNWISDVNLAYKRRAVEATRHIWRDGYREPLVHGALLEQGETLYLSSNLIVHHARIGLGLRDVFAERFQWGRLYGHIRAGSLSPAQRIVYSVAGPLIPVRLFARHARAQLVRGNAARFVKAMPLLGALLVAWTAGEVLGYITNRP